MGNTTCIHLQAPLVRKDPKEATATPPPDAPIPGRVRHPQEEEEACFQGTPGGAEGVWRAQGPGSRIQGSDVIQDWDPSVGAGNGDGGGWGGLGHPRFSSPAPTGKVTSTLRLSSSTCPRHPKVKRRVYKAGDGVTPSRPAPNFPTKPFSGPLGPGLTRCCRSAAERPPRCAAMRPTMRRGAGRERLRVWGLGARACARLGASSSRARAGLPAAAALARFPSFL